MGDRSSLDRLVLDHLPAALRFAVRLTGDADSAEELVQEALVRVAQRWGEFRGEAMFRTWLFRILINTFRDSLRRRRTRLAIADEEADEVPDARVVEPPEAALAGELGERVAAEVSRLPPRQREVLVLVAFEGLSVRDVAGVVGISEGNVHSTLSAARARLRERLAPYLGFAEK
ncbi:MAG: RNA polymerase sigma factor [Planctomycetia bacterium]|nr:RNA polymerase sigma factor [Planctomycetia bacterium]